MSKKPILALLALAAGTVNLADAVFGRYRP